MLTNQPAEARETELFTFKAALNIVPRVFIQKCLWPSNSLSLRLPLRNGIS